MNTEQKDQQGILESQADGPTREMLAKARKQTRAFLARKLKVSKETVRRIEKRTDLYLSTLRSYVEGVGGELTLMVKFPDWPPVILAGLGESAEKVEKKPKRRAVTTAKSKSKTEACNASRGVSACGRSQERLTSSINSSKIRTYFFQSPCKNPF